MTYNLTGEGDSTVNVGADNTKVYDKIKSFIDKYNTIVDKIQTKLTEKKKYDYEPLTDAQKEDMEDTQITAWETKAKQGILKNDNNLQTMLNSLRSAFTTAVSGAGFTMGRYGSNSIGLDTSQENTKPGHIDIVDPSKLKAAIATNGEQIYKMFANASTSSDKTTAYNENGIFARIKNIFQDNVGYTNTTLNTAILTKYANKQDDFSMTGSSGTGTLPNQIYQKQLLIDKLKDTFYDKQEAYYKKFASLETAMNNLNSQQSWLTQQLGS
jgi:flagellar hook-associated protein 2